MLSFITVKCAEDKYVINIKKPELFEQKLTLKKAWVSKKMYL